MRIGGAAYDSNHRRLKVSFGHIEVYEHIEVAAQMQPGLDLLRATYANSGEIDWVLTDLTTNANSVLETTGINSVADDSRDLIFGEEGNDILRGHGGNDFLTFRLCLQR